MNDSLPTDLKFVPKVFVIGLPKTGKTTLAKLIEKKLKVVRISIADVLKSVITRSEGKLTGEAK